jgi:hypothetical protein
MGRSMRRRILRPFFGKGGGMRISQALKERAEALVEFEGGTLTVGFNPRKVTPSLISRLDEIQESEFYGDVILDWDLTDEADAVIPFTEEGLASVPLPIRREVLKAVLRAPVPLKKSSGS